MVNMHEVFEEFCKRVDEYVREHSDEIAKASVIDMVDYRDIADGDENLFFINNGSITFKRNVDSVKYELTQDFLE